MKAGKFHALFIIFISFFLTFWISFLTIIDLRSGRYSRERIDRRLRWWARDVLRLVGMKLKVVDHHGFRPNPNTAYMIMVNHSSLYDIPITYVALPGSIRMLTKKELFRVPVWGRGMKEGEFVSVDRENRKQAFRDMEEAKRKMESGILLWVSPEGTRSLDGELGSFKKGGFMVAMKTGALILPVGIRGANAVLPAKTVSFQLGCNVEAHIGKPIDSSAYRRRDLDKLMREVEEQIRSLADLPGIVSAPSQ